VWNTSSCAAWPDATASAAVPPSSAATPLLQHRLRRVHDAGVDVAERLQAEQRGRVVDVVEDIGGRLVDRRRARARGRVGLCARVNGECLKEHTSIDAETLAMVARLSAKETEPAY
jgi:hypothetical protein